MRSSSRSASSPPRTEPLQPEIRKLGLVLALATVAIAVGMTQWPFHYEITRFAVGRRWSRVEWSWFPRTPRGHILLDRDFALNLVMLLPLGLGFGLWRRARAVRMLAEALALGIVTSATLELLQLATPYRYTSFADLWRNAFGCLVGGMIALAVSRAVQKRRSTP